MRIRSFGVHVQALLQIILIWGLLIILSLAFLSGCVRPAAEQPPTPPATHPLARQYIGFAVVNASFVHLLSEPGPSGSSQAYIRRGTVLRVVERRQLIIRGSSVTWILAEYHGAGSVSSGWLEESLVEIFDNESRANTAARNMLR